MDKADRLINPGPAVIRERQMLAIVAPVKRKVGRPALAPEERDRKKQVRAQEARAMRQNKT